MAEDADLLDDAMRHGCVLLPGVEADRLTFDRLEEELRRIGLRPEPIEDGTGHDTVHGRKESDGVERRGFTVVFGTHRFRLAACRPVAARAAALAAGATPVRRDPPTAEELAQAGLLLIDEADALHYPSAGLDAFLQIIAIVSTLFASNGVLWLRAMLWSDAAHFTAAINAYRTGDVLPVMHMIRFSVDGGPARATIRTHGLSLFSGQELRCADASALGAARIVRRLARLALDAIHHGPVTRRVTLAGLDPGEAIVLDPHGAADGAVPFVAVSIEGAAA